MATDSTTTTAPASSAPAATAFSANNTEYLIRFPPFPPVPAGVTVIPFREYKERGIRVAPGGEDNETEIDTYGVPTVPLASSHLTDWCKTETKRQKFNKQGGMRRRKKRRTGMVGGNAGPTIDNWMEYWEEREPAYRVPGSYDPHADAHERFYQGAWDFKNGRPWPFAHRQSGPVYVWGEFLRFAGIPAGQESSSATQPEPKKERNGNSDSDFDDDNEDDDPNAGMINLQAVVSVDAAMKAQAKTEAFLRDPALMLKVFLSSYARDRGIIWTDKNLTGAPALMQFFINFLIDNKVLPKREENAIKHESTRRIIEVALKELPLTSKLAKEWPDKFSLACKVCWGSKVEPFIFKPVTPTPEAQNGADQGGGTADSGITMPDPGWGDASGNSNTDGVGQEEGWGTSEGWGDNWGGEIITPAEDDKGTEELDKPQIMKVTDDTLAKRADENDAPVVEWEALAPATFFPVLGPTALPLTHTTGIVESSVRRIKAIQQPSADTSKFPIVKDISAEAVEGYLRRTFGVVIFEPWVNWNRGEEPHLAMPKILSTSCGAVKLEENAPKVEGGEAASNSPVPTTALPPFDPLKDEISVLVDPEHLELLCVGMGCLCTWVQLARVEDLEPQDPKKKKKKNAKLERFWYIEESLRVIPSYYTYLG